MFELEAPRRLSQSRLWPLTTEFYERQGNAAFTRGTVPSRISCNAFIADAYAQIIAGYLRDVGRDAPTVTVLELGAGAGHFGFLLTRAILAAVAAYGPGSRTAAFRYVMTDVARSNVAAWQAHAETAALISAGHMDTAVLDVSDPDSARSETTGASLAAMLAGGPVVLIGNYLFDSLINDAFRVERGQLFEVQVGLDLRHEVGEVVGSSKLFEALRFRQQLAPMQLPYYPEAAFDAILRSYVDDLTEATFLFPVAALRSIERIRRLSDGNVLLLASDKARSSVGQIEGNTGLSLALTGTFSSTANLDAMARWFIGQGGSIKFPDIARQHFDTYALLLGDVGRVGETEAAYDRHVRGFGPADYWSIARELIQSVPRLPARGMLALLKFSRFDPYFLAKIEDAVLDAIDAADPAEREQFEYAVDQALARVTPDDRDMAFILGRMYQRLGRPERALASYRRSTATHGANPSTLHNMSLCHGALGRTDEALDAFRQALALQPREMRAAAE